jgi:hypothetical protein
MQVLKKESASTDIQIDFALEDRIKRCRACISEFRNASEMLGQMDGIRGTTGKVVRETLNDLSVFQGVDT